MRHLQKAGVGEPPERSGAHVGRLPVPGQCRPTEDPDRHDDHHLQEDLRQPRHSVEVSLELSVPGTLIKKYNIMYNSLCLRLKDT